MFGFKTLARRKAFGNDTCQVKCANVGSRVKGFMIRWYTNKAGLLGLQLISNSAEYSSFFLKPFFVLFAILSEP